MTDPILSYHQGRQRDWVALLSRIVELESPTSDKAAVDHLGAFIHEELARAGARVETLQQARYGDVLRASVGTPGHGRVLVLCHIDTVWPVGTLARMPVAEREGRLHGPGIFDMKGGVMHALAALHALHDLGRSPHREVVLLFNTDEEVGSLASRPIIEDEARQSDAVLVLEPSIPPDGALKTSRSGVGRFVVTVTGRPSHSGADPRAGVSAVEELARQVLRLHALTDHECGTTVNVGVVQGGTRPNVVAAEARAELDVRVRTREEGERVEAAIRGLTPFDARAGVHVEGRMTRPPMVRSQSVEPLLGRAREIAAALGFTLRDGHTGGGSDGNFTAALGIPTLDGLGAVGDGAHAFDEHVLVDAIPQRVALLTHLLAGA